MKNTINDKLPLHKIFLQKLFDEEIKIKDALDNKTAQLLSQTGLIATFFSLAVTSFLNKISHNFLGAVVFAILLSIAIYFYIITICYAMKNYNKTEKFKYSYPNYKNVKTNKGNVTNFIKEEIKDLFKGIRKNQKLNAIKGTNLIYAYKNFQRAFILSVISVLIGIAIVLFHPETNKVIVNINKPIKTQDIDSTLPNLINILDEQNKKILSKMSDLNDSLKNIKIKLNSNNARLSADNSAEK